MGGGGGSAPAPVTNNYEETMREALEAQIDLAPDLYQAESNNWYGRPAYARLEQDIIKDALLGEEKYIYGPGKEAERWGGGATYIIGGNQKTKFSDGQTRKAGYSADGKKFLGTSQFEQDLLERTKQQQTATEINLAKKYGAELTKAYRSQGDVKGALKDVENLADKKSYNANQDRIYNPYIDLGDIAYGENRRIRDVTAPSQAERVGTPIKGRDAFSIANALVRDVNPNLITNPAKVISSIITGKDAFADDVSAKDVKNSSVSAKDITAQTTGAKSINAKSIGAQTIGAQSIGSRDVNATNIASQNIGSERVAADAIGLGNLRDELYDQAIEDLSAGGDLTQQEVRNIQQDARAAATARGRARDYGSVVDEVENLDSARRQRQAERRSFAGQVLGQEAGLRQSDITTDLQADLANQQAAMQAGLANQTSSLQAAQSNQQAQLQAEQLNQQAAMQASQSNQQANLQAAQLNQQANMQAALANQSTALQADQLNAANALQSDLANQQAALQAASSNQQAGLQAALANQQTGFQTSQLNAANALQADLANQQTGLQASLANQNVGLQVGQLNAANSMQSQLANQQAGLQANLANQQARMQASLANQQSRMARADEISRVSMANQQSDIAQNQFVMQAMLANQQAGLQDDAMNMEAQRLNQMQDAARADRTLTAEEKDINRNIQIKQLNTQLRMQGLINDRQFAAQRVGLEQATSSDPFMAITGRPSGAAVTTGQALYGNGQSGIGAGPNLFNPAQGAEWIANQSAMVNSYNAANYAAKQSRKAGMFSGAMGAVGSIGSAMLCWVAREVYGAENPKWLEFREWVKNDSPSWFFKFYLNYGEKFAEYISDKPKLKWIIRKWMDSRIRR